MQEGDYVDLVIEVKEASLKVKRVKIMKVLNEKTQKDKYRAIVRVWRSGFDVEKPDIWEAPKQTD